MGSEKHLAPFQEVGKQEDMTMEVAVETATNLAVKKNATDSAKLLEK